MLCAFSPFISTSLGIYVKEDGSTSFSLRDEYGRAISAKYEAPKVPSTNTKLGDAMLVAKFLKSFKDNARSQVKIDGPTEEEPYVVMTTPDVAKNWRLWKRTRNNWAHFQAKSARQQQSCTWRCSTSCKRQNSCKKSKLL